jgi:hypothetical protein
MKLFTARQVREAIAFAKSGGQALHIHPFTSSGVRLFRRYPESAHLFDMDKERLIATSKSLGLKVIKIEREGTETQHIDLCARPLSRAKSMCTDT